MNIFKIIHEIAQYEYVFVNKTKTDCIIADATMFDLLYNDLICTNNENSNTILKLSDDYDNFDFSAIWVDPPNGFGITAQTLSKYLTKEYWKDNVALEPAFILAGAKPENFEILNNCRVMIFI